MNDMMQEGNITRKVKEKKGEMRNITDFWVYERSQSDDRKRIALKMREVEKKTEKFVFFQSAGRSKQREFQTVGLPFLLIFPYYFSFYFAFLTSFPYLAFSNYFDFSLQVVLHTYPFQIVSSLANFFVSLFLFNFLATSLFCILLLSRIFLLSKFFWLSNSLSSLTSIIFLLESRIS